MEDYFTLKAYLRQKHLKNQDFMEQAIKLSLAELSETERTVVQGLAKLMIEEDARKMKISINNHPARVMKQKEIDDLKRLVEKAA